MIKISKQKKFNVIIASTLGLLIAIVGVVVVIRSFAATGFYSTEIESNVISGSASIVRDASASNGSSVLFDGKKAYGILQNTLPRIDSNINAGANTAFIELSWSNYEPSKGNFNTAYRDEIKNTINVYKSKNMKVILSLGVHYTPNWVLSLPDARFVNQYGTQYVDGSSGKNIANLVFNNTIRSHYESYMQRVFADVGNDIYAVRAGGGWYGELNYPDPNFNGNTNSYWGYDRIATGQTTGLPANVAVNPVPNWRPGMSSPNGEARQFIEWYMKSQQNYHDWQIQTTRKYFNGYITMMYPGAGIRQGQLENAISSNLNGSTGPEQNGEIQKGLDYERYILGIRDQRVMPYTTWLEAKWPGMDDTSTNQGAWSPIKLIKYHAERNPLKTSVAGESGGRDSFTDMQHTFEQAERYKLRIVLWAFESDLYSGQYATIDQLKTLITQYP